MFGNALTFGSLFAGIGGFDLGFERAGWRCLWQVENDPYHLRVLSRHWPDVMRREDACFVDDTLLRPTAMIAAFPKCPVPDRVRLRHFRNHLKNQYVWSWYLNWVRTYRPIVLVMEHLPRFQDDGWPMVRDDLSKEGYGFVKAYILTAGQFGAWHLRPRIYVVAIMDADTFEVRRVDDRLAELSNQAIRVDEARSAARFASGLSVEGRANAGRLFWLREPKLCRMVDGISSELDHARIKALSYATVPFVAEAIGHVLREAIR